MPPESHLSTMPVLQEAERIKSVILPIQEQINTAQQEHEVELFASIREVLGYAEPEIVDMDALVDTRIVSKQAVVSPDLVEAALPLTQNSAATTLASRSEVKDILLGRSDKLIVVMGPCSIHDADAVLEYAKFVKEMRDEYGEDLEIIMRFYSEKPRSETGWKGYSNDPYLDGSNDMNTGLIATRMLAVRITDMGVPLGQERLNPNTPQYLNGLITYDSIGARNAEDQNARGYVSGTSSIPGMKNGTDGSIAKGISALVAANDAHTFVGLESNGQQALVGTKGNELAHVILRGGELPDGTITTNFDADSVEETMVAIRAKNEKTGLKIPEAAVVDASHKNKVHGEQMPAVESIAKQITAGSIAIRGVMIESNLVAGNQDLKKLGPDNLEYGKSITDTCVDLEETRTMLTLLAAAVRRRRQL